MKLTFGFKGKKYSTTKLGFWTIITLASLLTMSIGVFVWEVGIPFMDEKLDYASCKMEMDYIFDTYDPYTFTKTELPTEMGNACEAKYHILAVENAGE